MGTTRPAIRSKDKNPDKLDRYRMHLIEGFKLKEKEIVMLSRYRKANTLLCFGYTRNHIIEVFKKEEDLSESQIYCLIRDSIKLYGDVTQVDKNGLRQIAYEYYKVLSYEAKKAGDFSTAISAQEKADKIIGLFDKDDSSINPNDFIRPTTIIFTTATEVLKEQQQSETDTYAIEE